MIGPSTIQLHPAAAYEPYNAQKYGAIPDGDTNSTAAIQAAITAAAVDGGVVYLPPGEYIINSSLQIDSGVTLQGAGMYATTIRQTSTTHSALVGADITGFDAKDLTLQGPSDGITLGTVDGVYIDQTGLVANQNITIENVQIRNFSRHGVHIEDPITSVFTNVRAQNCAGFGFRINLGTSLSFISCYVNGCYAGGYELVSTSYTTLNSCACDSTGNGPAYRVQGGNNVTLVGCGSEDISGVSYLFHGATQPTVLSCYSKDNPSIAYHVTASTVKALLENVRERDPEGTATASIQVDSGSTCTVIQNSTITEPSYAAGTTRVLTDGTLSLAHVGTSINAVSRGAATNFAAYVLRTADADRWSLQMVNNSTNDLQLTDSANGGVALLAESRETRPNLSLLTSTKSYGGGVGVVFVANASTVPGSNPTGGGVLFAEGGALKWRGSSGTVTTIAPA